MEKHLDPDRIDLLGSAKGQVTHAELQHLRTPCSECHSALRAEAEALLEALELGLEKRPWSEIVASWGELYTRQYLCPEMLYEDLARTDDSPLRDHAVRHFTFCALCRGEVMDMADDLGEECPARIRQVVEDYRRRHP